MPTPLRRLEGVTYWVIEDPRGIYDFINTNIRKEWEADARSVGRNPQEDPWLQSLSKRKWLLEIIDIGQIKLNPDIMSYVDVKKGYNFAEELAKRREALRRTIEVYDSVIWPVIVRGEDMQLVDGYCRYAALREMNITRIYAYMGCT